MLRSTLAAGLLAALALPAFAVADGAPVLGKVSVVRRAPTSAEIEVSVDPNGSATRVHAEFGDTRALGGRTGVATVTTSTPQTLVSMSLNRLRPGRTYYFRVIATNASGSVRSAIGSATTSRSAHGLLLKGTEVSFAIATGRNGLYPWRLLAMRLPTGLPAGTNVSLRCHRACRGGAATTAGAGLRQLRFGKGIALTRHSVVELRETKPGYVGRVRRFVFRRAGALLEAIKTLSSCLVRGRIAPCPSSG